MLFVKSTLWARLGPHGPLWAILAGYLMIGAAYAALTPAWQTPDEPAHYNVIAQMAAGEWPALQAGDYDQTYLEHLVGRGFPPELPVSGVRYQDYQPPLYYVLAVPVFWLSGGALTAVRLFSLALGAGVVMCAYALARAVWPRQPRLAVTAAGWVAFIPQHLAMLAGVNNDALAELWVALGLLMLARLAQRGAPWRWGETAALGMVVGLALLTKVQAYVLGPAALALLVWQARDPAHRAPMMRRGAALLGVAAALGSVYWARNWVVCGAWDVLCGNLHNQVVVGQPTTAWWLAQFGWENWLNRFITFTFQSFWGVFGWMGVFMDARVYLVLLAACGLWAVGAGAALTGWARLSAGQRQALAVLALSTMQTLGLYLLYNVNFVQHQGRYLFPALLPLSLAVSAATWQWAQWLRPLPWVGRWVEVALPALTVLGLAGLSAFALYRFVLPALG